MQIETLAIPEVQILTPRKHGDERGFLSETYHQRRLAEGQIHLTFVQDNHTYTAHAGTVRGLHYQLPPRAQGKLVRVLRGAILDVAVDVRRGSPTFGNHVSAVISAERWNQVLVPVGFAHGFVTLEPDTEVLYKMTDFYSAEHERGILWSDPRLGIDWGVGAGKARLSEKDLALPTLAEAVDLLHYSA